MGGKKKRKERRGMEGKGKKGTGREEPELSVLVKTVRDDKIGILWLLSITQISF